MRRMGQLPEGVRHAAKEIADSERTYLSEIDALRTVFGGPLKTWTSNLASGIGEADGLGGIGCKRVAAMVERLFNPLDEVVSFVRRFLDDLDEAESRGSWLSVFKKHEREMVRVYGDYLATFNAVHPEITKLRAKSKSLAAFLTCCELQPANKRKQTLESLWSMPFQRVMRYEMLLEELRKRANKAGFQYEGGDDALQAAVDIAKRVAHAAQTELDREVKRKASLRRVSTAFGKCDTCNEWQLPSSSKTLIFDDGQLNRTTKSRQVECYLALFDDAVAYGDADKGLMKSQRRRNSISMAAGGNDPGVAGGSPSGDHAHVNDEIRYVMKDHVAIEEVWAARGEHIDAGIVIGIKLDPWEFLLILRDTEAFVVSTGTPTAASDWVERITAASRARQKETQPKSLLSAYLFRGGKVVSGKFEIAPHSSRTFYVATPSENSPKASSRRAEKLSLQDRPADPVHQGGGFSLFPEGSSTTRIISTPSIPSSPLEQFIVTLPLDKESNVGLELRNDNGAVVVKSIVPQSVADAAGLEPSDHIYKVGHDDVYTTAEVVEALKSARPPEDSDPSTVSVVVIVAGRRQRSSSQTLPVVREATLTTPENHSSSTLVSPHPPPASPPPPPPPAAEEGVSHHPIPRLESVPPPALSPQHKPADDEDDVNLCHHPAAQQAANLGFKRAQVARAVFAGANDLDAILNWILDQQNQEPDRTRSVTETPLTPPPPSATSPRRGIEEFKEKPPRPKTPPPPPPTTSVTSATSNPFLSPSTARPTPDVVNGNPFR